MLVSLSFCRFFLTYQSHSPLCSFFVRKNQSKIQPKTDATYYFHVTKIEAITFLLSCNSLYIMLYGLVLIKNTLSLIVYIFCGVA